MAADLPERYVELGLAFDRLRPGLVDAYTGDPAVRARVLAGPIPDPAELGRRADQLRGELSAGGLGQQRAEFLDGQLAGLAMTARVLGGERVGFVAQVQECFGVTPTAGDEASYADAHRRLDALLPGSGSLAGRYAAYRAGTRVPAGQLAEAVRRVSALLRERTRAVAALPDSERVDYALASGPAWAGLNRYLGGFRSRVSVNAAPPVGLAAVLSLVAHESYPGHHTERCRKQQLMPHHAEHTIWLVDTPENLVAEGLADQALTGVGLGAGWGQILTELYDDLGIAYDGVLGEQIALAAAPLGRVRQDAALLLHQHGRPEQEAVRHLLRWGLHSPERADKAMAFLTAPLWRTYISTYVEGADLVGRWLRCGPDLPGRFARLLAEPLTPSRLAADVRLAASVT